MAEGFCKAGISQTTFFNWKKYAGVLSDEMSQQYQQLESKGNLRCDLSELVADGLRSELLLVPQDKLNKVAEILGHEFPSPRSAPIKLGERRDGQSSPLTMIDG